MHHPFDINKDHQIAAQSTLVALRPISYHNVKPEIRAFETPSSTDQVPNELPYIFRPNFYVDIQLEWNKILLALKSYVKELKIISSPKIYKGYRSTSNKKRFEAGLQKAEAFSIIEKFGRNAYLSI